MADVRGSHGLGDRMTNAQCGGDAVHSVGSEFSGGHSISQERVLKAVKELTDYLASDDASEPNRKDAQWILQKLQESIARYGAKKDAG